MRRTEEKDPTEKLRILELGLADLLSYVTRETVNCNFDGLDGRF